MADGFDAEEHASSVVMSGAGGVVGQTVAEYVAKLAEAERQVDAQVGSISLVSADSDLY